MSDSWERRPLACTPGYNNCGDVPLFTVTYDALNDRLVMQASLPVFGAADNINGAGEYPTGTPGWTFNISSGNFSIQSSTELWLDGAWGFLVGSPGVEATIEQMDFYNAGAVLIGTWVGSVAVTEPVGSFVEFYSYVDYYGDTTFAPTPSCATVGSTPQAVAGAFLYGTFGVDVDGFRFATTDGNKDYRLSVDPSYIGGGAIDPGFALIQDATLAGTTVASIVPLDIAGVPIGSPTVVSDFEYVENVIGDDSVPGEMSWTFVSDNSFVPGRIALYSCPNNLVNYYDPAGPNNGLNPGTATIVTWTSTAIVIQDTAFNGALDIYLTEWRNAGGGRVHLEWADPLYQL